LNIEVPAIVLRRAARIVFLPEVRVPPRSVVGPRKGGGVHGGNPASIGKYVYGGRLELLKLLFRIRPWKCVLPPVVLVAP